MGKREELKRSWYSTGKAALLCGMSHRTMQRWASEGLLRAKQRITGRWEVLVVTYREREGYSHEPEYLGEPQKK